MERIIQTTGTAWFMTRPVTYPVQILLSSEKPATNSERRRLSMAVDTMLAGMLEAGLPAERLRLRPGGDPMQFLKDQTALQAGTIIDCATQNEMGLVHGQITKHSPADVKAAFEDLPPVHGENPADRAQALARATDAATASAVAVANQVGVTLGELLSAEELDGGQQEGIRDAERITVRLRCAFAIS